MNPVSQESPNNGSEILDMQKEPNVATSMTTTATQAMQTAPKRSYAKRDKKAPAPTIASLTKDIETKNLEIEAIQADIEGLMAKRNELFLYESVGMGLMDIIADPEKAKLLARFVEESQAI